MFGAVLESQRYQHTDSSLFQREVVAAELTFLITLVDEMQGVSFSLLPLGLTRPHILWVPEALSPAVKRTKFEADIIVRVIVVRGVIGTVPLYVSVECT
jgi:hypothetical protein